MCVEGDQIMRKTQPHFERVPVEVVLKIIEQQDSPASSNGHSKQAGKKSSRAKIGPRAAPKKVEVLKS